MQGGGLARALARDSQGPFKARAVTRSVNSDKAGALMAFGVEAVTADLDDIESLKRAFSDAHGAFCVTNFWEHFSPENEYAQAKNGDRGQAGRTRTCHLVDPGGYEALGAFE